MLWKPHKSLCCVWTHLTRRWRMAPARPLTHPGKLKFSARPHGTIYISSHLDKDRKRRKQSNRSLSDYPFIYDCSPLWPSQHNTAFVAKAVCAVPCCARVTSTVTDYNWLQKERVCLYISRQVLFIYPWVKSAAHWSHGP